MRLTFHPSLNILPSMYSKHHGYALAVKQACVTGAARAHDIECKSLTNQSTLNLIRSSAILYLVVYIWHLKPTSESCRHAHGVGFSVGEFSPTANTLRLISRDILTASCIFSWLDILILKYFCLLVTRSRTNFFSSNWRSLSMFQTTEISQTTCWRTLFINYIIIGVNIQSHRITQCKERSSGSESCQAL